MIFQGFDEDMGKIFMRFNIVKIELFVRIRLWDISVEDAICMKGYNRMLQGDGLVMKVDSV